MASRRLAVATCPVCEYDTQNIHAALEDPSGTWVGYRVTCHGCELPWTLWADPGRDPFNDQPAWPDTETAHLP